MRVERYWTPARDTVMMQCRAEWRDDPSFGVLQLTPRRIELWTGQELLAGTPPRVWLA